MPHVLSHGGWQLWIVRFMCLNWGNYRIRESGKEPCGVFQGKEDRTQVCEGKAATTEQDGLSEAGYLKHIVEEWEWRGISRKDILKNSNEHLLMTTLEVS